MLLRDSLQLLLRYVALALNTFPSQAYKRPSREIVIRVVTQSHYVARCCITLCLWPYLRVGEEGVMGFTPPRIMLGKMLPRDAWFFESVKNASRCVCGIAAESSKLTTLSRIPYFWGRAGKGVGKGGKGNSYRWEGVKREGKGGEEKKWREGRLGQNSEQKFWLWPWLYSVALY